MRDGLRLVFGAGFSSVEACHQVAERSGKRTFPSGRSYSLIFSASGGLIVSTANAEIRLRAHDALVLEPRGSGAVSLRYSRGSELYLIRFRWDQWAGGHPRETIYVPMHTAVVRPARLTHVLRMYTERGKRRGASRSVLYHLLTLALAELARSSTEGIAAMPQQEPCRESIASRVDAFVAAHYHERIGTPEIAAELRYNPGYLEHAYRLERRMSIRDALHARRMREARAQLLLQRTAGIAQVAVLCGYTDPGYFRRLFKKATNMTPRAYRALNGAPPESASDAARRGPLS
jgi:AraC-like DNA-binding protein